MKKEGKLGRIYSQFEQKYKNMPEEEMQKEISDLEKEINGKEASINNLDEDAKQALQKNIDDSKKRLDNLKGYMKNRVQIEGILKYKDHLEERLEIQTKLKDSSLATLKNLRQEFNALNNKLSNEKYTGQLDNMQYNSLLEQKQKLEENISEVSNTYKDAWKKIRELQTNISKCSLAWKSLFTNKTWDDIHAKAVSLNTRYTRHIDSEKNLPISNKKQQVIESKVVEEKVVEPKVVKPEVVEEKVEEQKTEELEVSEPTTLELDEEKSKEDQKLYEQAGSILGYDEDIVENKRANRAETTAIEEKKKGSFIRNLWRRFVNWITKTNENEEIIEDEEIERPQHSRHEHEQNAPRREAEIRTSAPRREAEVRTSAPRREAEVRTSAPEREAEVKVNTPERKAEVKVNTPEKEPEIKSDNSKKERDAFIDALRQHVDVDYKKQVVEEKLKRESNMHKDTSKEDETR